MGIASNGAGAGKDWLALLAETDPDRHAIVDDRPDGRVDVVTFGRLHRLANQWANGLLASGLGVGSRLAWCSRNSVEILVLANAARRIGALPLSINQQLQRNEIVALLSASRATLVVAQDEFADHFVDLKGVTDVETVVVFGGPPRPGQVGIDAFLAGCEDERLVGPDGETLDPQQPSITGGAVINGPTTFTGGTTGRPKGVVYDWSRLRDLPPQQRIEDEIYGPDAHVFITSGSLSHAGPYSHTNAALAKGGTVVLQRRFDPEDWLRLVSKYGVTASYCSPTVIRLVCALPAEVKARYDVSTVRVIFAGAAKWSFALKLAYRDTFPPGTLWEIYGSSELGSNTVTRPDEHWTHPESCGRPVDGYDIVLLGPDRQPISRPHEQGVLYVKSPYILFGGYEGDPAATEAARWGDYWTVGDIAYFDEEGFYYISDRAKDMVVSGGINIYPAEIEAVIDSHPGVLECAVFGIPDERWGERVHALVVARDGTAVDPDSVVAYCREHLASYKVPGQVELVAELPHSLAGKILKRQLRDRYWEGAGRLV